MSEQEVIKETEQGWIIELPDEFAESMGVQKNSIRLLGYKDGKIEVEVLPPPSHEVKRSAV